MQQGYQKKIENLLEQGEIGEAINELINTTQYEDQSIYESVVLLKARNSRLQNARLNGTINQEEAFLEKNKLVQAILEILEVFSVDPDKLKISEIRNLIGNGKLGEAIGKLKNFQLETDSNDSLSLISNITLLEGRLNKLERDLQKGVITKTNSDITYNQIVQSILTILNEVSDYSVIITDSSVNKENKHSLLENRPQNNISKILSKEVKDLYFDLEQIKAVFGDMFKAKFDLIVIPKNEYGGISPSMEDGMKRLGYSHKNYNSEPGSVDIIPENENSNILGRVCYGISVASINSSSLEIIEKLGNELGKLSLGASGYKNIVAPLLGTGAGGLDEIQVFNTLEKGFKNTCDKDANLSIHILDRRIFKKISKLKRERLFSVIVQSRSRFDSDNVLGKDQLDISHEVDSFANLIISSELEPPLSIGLFGNWGTGKSFFMEKLAEKVNSLNLNAKNLDRETGVCKNIVQIKFNAWYYVDANLWASMVSNIFEKLALHVGIKSEEEKIENDLYEKLASTEEQVRLAKFEADKFSAEIETLEHEIIRLKEQRQKKRQTLEEIKLEHVLKEVQKDTQVSDFLNKAQEMLGFSELKKVGDEAQRSIGDIEGLIMRYQSTQGKVFQIYKSIVNLNNWSLIILLILLVTPFLCFHIIDYLDFFNNRPILELIGQVGSIITAIALFIRQIIDQSDPILQGINKGVEYLDKAKNRLQNLQDLAYSESDEKIAMLEHEYEQINEEHQKAIALKWNAEKNLKLVQKEIVEIKTGKRLDSFIQKRIDSSDYQKHLGLISIVRKDFDRLSRYLQEHRSEEALDQTLKKVEGINNIDRIILYIDDLDRCPPEKVVDVLQAIHLILAFPLFVVVVGVDVRWVSKSLLKKYGKMLSSHDSELSDDPELKMELQGSATPYDYLEKIFQIPFKLKSINDNDKKKYLSNLLKKDLLKEKNILEPQAQLAGEKPTEKQVKVIKEKTTEKETDKALKGTQKTANVDQRNPVEEKEKESKKTINNNIQRWDTVHLTEQEYDFIIALSPIAGNSARTLKRFINLARLLKSNHNWVPAIHEVNTKPYHACLFMLAVVVGSPWMFPLFFSLIKAEENEENEKQAITLEQLVKKKEIEIGKEIDKHGHINKEWDNLRAFLENIENHQNIDVKAINSYNLKSLRQIAPIVSRFSFRALEDVEVSNFLKQLETE